ncbi:Exportin-4, partial [Fasciola hepatica]
QVSPAARQRVLGAVGALVKRAAAAHAEEVATAWRSTFPPNPSGDSGRLAVLRPRILTHPPDDPGPPCPLMVHLIEHVEALIQAALNESEEKAALDQCLLGLCILSALLDEVSNAEDSVHLNLPLEAHIFLRARFQDFELVRIFHSLLCLVDRFVHRWSSVPFDSLTSDQNEIMFRLICCLDCVTSWDFLPRELVGFYAARLRRTGHSTCFRPGLRWSSVFGPDSLPTTLLLLIKLHTWIRGSDMLGTRTLSCLTRISSLTGPLTDPVTPLTGLNEPDSNGTPPTEDNHQPPSLAYLFHILAFMDHLSLWLMTEPDELTSSHTVLMALPTTQQAALIEDCDRRLADAQSMPHISPSELHAYELPLLSDLMQNIVLSSSRAWEPVETALALPTSVAAERHSIGDFGITYHHALLALVILDRFTALIAALLTQCLSFAAKWSDDSDGDGKLAHEAVERLFSNWIDLVEFIPACGSDSTTENGFNWYRKSGSFSSTTAMPLTVGSSHELECRTQQVAQMVHLIRTNTTQHQTSLFQAFLISKLVAPVGMRQPWTDQDEDIDLDLDENDLNAWEDSLFATGACGLANAKHSCEILLRLIDERVDKLVQLHNQAPDQGKIDLYEDLHWLLLVTGHFLVSGPALLNSVLRPVCTWGAEFSIPQALLHLSVDEPVDIGVSRSLLRMSASGQCTNPAEPWPPVTLMIDQVPSFVRLVSSVIRLLWLQVSLGLGSAQLAEDNFWLTTRFALVYLCYNVLDREALMANKSRSPILTVLQDETGEPQPAHQGLNRNVVPVRQLGYGDKENHTDGLLADATRSCIQGLLTCARLALDNWSSEPQVIASATTLIGVFSRNSPSPSINLTCPAWYDICAVLCGTNKQQHELWPSLTSDTLVDLVQSCLCGSWAIDKQRLTPAIEHWHSSADSEPLLLQLLHSLRDRLLLVTTCFSDQLGGGSAAAATTVNSPAMESLMTSLSALRGIARALGFLAAQSDSATDLVSYLWTGLLFPILNSGSTVLILRCHNSSDVIQTLLHLFSEVADSCLIYLANVPSAQLDNPVSTDTGPLTPTGSVASSVFLNLTVTLCQNYSKQNVEKTSFEPTAEEERVIELRLFLTLLSRILAHEFELRLTVWSTTDRPNQSTNASSSVCAVDVAVVGLGFILPMISEQMLMVPELCRAFYSLASYACELRVEALAHLSSSQLNYFGQLIRLGIFGSAANAFPTSSAPLSSSLNAFSGVDNSVTHQCLEIITAVIDYCLTVRARSVPSAELQLARHLVTSLGLDTRLLTDLFTLITKDTYSVDLEAVFSTAILDLIHLDRDAYAQLVSQWLNDCGPEGSTVFQRLRDAFESLGSPTETDEAQINEQNPFTLGFTDFKPNRIARLDFQQRFHTFVAEVRSFVCRG